MECAIVLGKRGFRRVHVVDSDAEPGGTMRWVASLPGLGEWRRVVNWRVVQISKLSNVELICATELDATGVREYGAEIVICATGARWASDGVSAFTHAPLVGADPTLAWVMTPEQVMLDHKRPPGERVIVYDGEGYFTAAGIAELLAREGHQVELVTCLDQVAPVCDGTLEGPMLRRRLHDVGVTMRRGVTLSTIRAGHAIANDEFDQPLELSADGVVLVTQRHSNDALYHTLSADPQSLAAEGIEALHRVGDCVAPRLLADAIFDGHRLAREIDTHDPAVALPYKRERPTLQSSTQSTEPA
jgi:dimethylamine/trimethylamine dehydrogenase